jgi:hypothetical protein
MNLSPFLPSLAMAALACSGSTTRTPPERTTSTMDTDILESQALPEDDGSRFGPLDVGADWQSYARVNTAAFPSETHGGRMVDVYVNAVGLEAFKPGARTPVGSIVVKPSREADGRTGPLFVMQKRAAGYRPEHGNWYFAIHWADPPPRWKQVLGGPIYWRTPSTKTDYCSDCHDGYHERDHLGGVPAALRAW